MIFNTHRHHGASSVLIPITDLSVGDIVKVMENGTTAVDYIVVQKNNPSADYNADGIWAMRKDIVSMMQMSSDSLIAWAGEDIDDACSTFYTSALTAYEDVLLNVMIPCNAWQRQGYIGDETRYRRCFALSFKELGFSEPLPYMFTSRPIKGTKLSYFDATNAASTKRVATFGGTASLWATRSNNQDFDTVVALNEADIVSSVGALTRLTNATIPVGIRPTIVISKSAMVDQTTHLLSFSI